jgi:hypothetical protein
MARYSKGSQQKVERAMHEMKQGKLKSGRSGKKVKNRKQAIAIGLSEARKQGSRVPGRRSAAKKKAAPKKRRTAGKRSAPKKKSAARKRSTAGKRTGRKRSSMS